MSSVSSTYVQWECHKAVGSQGLSIRCKCCLWTRLDEDESDECECSKYFSTEITEYPVPLRILEWRTAHHPHYGVAQSCPYKCSHELGYPVNDGNADIDSST